MITDVVTLGETMSLFMAEPGMPLRSATRFVRSIAGAEATVAIGLTRLGHSATYFGRVGADPLGESVLDHLRAEGVDVRSVVVDPHASTGVLVRDCLEGRGIEVVYRRSGSAGSRLSPDDLDDAALGRCRMLHLTGITPVLGDDPLAAVRRAGNIARGSGASISFDPNLRSRLAGREHAVAVLRPLCDMADVVLASEDEAAALSGFRERDAAADWFLGRGASVVVIKSGEAGAWATDGSRTWRQPALPVRAVDPVGAGDAFAAGFLSARLRGLELQECLREAAAVAALAVQVPSDVAGLPSARQRDEALAGLQEVRR